MTEQNDWKPYGPIPIEMKVRLLQQDLRAAQEQILTGTELNRSLNEQLEALKKEITRLKEVLELRKDWE